MRASQDSGQEIRLVISGGGTGGHVYPALAVASELDRPLSEGGSERRPALLYIGARGGMEESIVVRRRLAFQGIASGPLRGKGPAQAPVNLGRMIWGFGQALGALRGFGARAVLATGGYVCVPVVLAAWLARVPSLIFLPDVVPGLAVRALARFATRIAVSFAETQRHLPAAKTVATGYPVRPELFTTDRAAARRRLGLANGLPVLLVLGGSRGARSINLAIRDALPRLLRVCQVVHVAGEADAPHLRRATSALPEDLRCRYSLHAYLHEEMASALAAADVIVSRAGASVMGEYPAVGAASVLVPYPYAGAHQRLNAAQLVAKGAAVQLDDAALGKGVLAETVCELLADRAQLEAMRAAARRLARPEAGAAIAELAWQLARGGKPLPGEG